MSGKLAHGPVRVHRRVAVAVSRVRDGRAAAARRRLHRTVRSATRGRRPGRLLHRARRLAGRLERATAEPDRAVPDRRRPHRQPQPAGQAASRPVRGGLAGGRAAALRRGVAELLAGPRPRASAAGCRSATATRVDHRLVRIDEPILRVPQLAIHLAEDRKSVDAGPAAPRQRGLGRRRRRRGRSSTTSPSAPGWTPPTCSAPT